MMMPACPYIRRFVHPSARSFAGRPVCAAEALRRLCVATHRLRTAAGVCIVRRIASRPPCPLRPVASTLRSFPRPVRRIVSLLLYPPNCLPAAVSAAPRLPPPGESGTHAPSCGIRRIRGYVRSLRPARLVSGSSAAAARPESKISIKAYSGTAKNSYFWWQKNARSALRCVRTERFRQAGRRSAFARAIPEDGNDREKQQRKT